MIGPALFVICTGYATVGFFVGLIGSAEVDLTLEKSVAVGTLWPLTLAVMTARGAASFYRDSRDQARIDKMEREARIEREFQGLLEDMEGDQ